jgi:N-methylhydantoinase B
VSDGAQARAAAAEPPRAPEDPFTEEIVKDKLGAIADEMGIVLARTSMSPVVYEVLDFACGLTDAAGQVIAQTNGITVFTGTFRPQIESVLRKFGAGALRAGDVYVTNDPYAGATHVCDICLIAPIFDAGELRAFAVSITHWVDIGGGMPGSIPPDATEIFQEGLLVPCLRLARDGALDDSIMDLLRANVRLPRMAIGDLQAGLAAVRIGERGVQELCARYGAGTLASATGSLLEQGDRLSRAAIAAIPNGVYAAHDVIDGDGISEDPIPIEVAVTVADETIVVDFAGTHPQVQGPVNCTRGALESACKTVFRAITSPQAPSNEGAFRPFEIRCPAGTVFTAERPAPTGWYYESTAFATELVWRALAPVLPEQLGAGSYVSLCATYVVGPGEAGGDDIFVLVEPNDGGWGAGPELDGESALIASNDGDTYNFPVEVIESRFPLRVEQYALATAQGSGAGRRRGGFGAVRDYRVLDERGAVSYGSIGGWRRRPWGLAGGGEGTTNAFEYLRGDGTRSRHGRVTRMAMQAGDVIRVITGGGGGYGDPREREPERVAADVFDGYLSAEQAKEVYGVVVDPRTDEVDGPATADRRRA